MNPADRHFIEHNGIKDTIKGWAKRTGLSPSCIIRRRLRGLEIAEVLSTTKYANRIFSNKKAIEYCKRFPNAKKVCADCGKEKKLHFFRPNGHSPSGKRKFYHICKTCESNIRHGKVQWRTLEEREMRTIRFLRKIMDGLDVSHSVIPSLQEPYVSLRVYLDQ